MFERKSAHTYFKRMKVARATMPDDGSDWRHTKEDLDDMFGWKQAERAKDMQLHNAGPLERSVRARLTMIGAYIIHQGTDGPACPCARA